MQKVPIDANDIFTLCQEDKYSPLANRTKGAPGDTTGLELHKRVASLCYLITLTLATPWIWLILAAISGVRGLSTSIMV